MKSITLSKIILRFLLLVLWFGDRIRATQPLQGNGGLRRGLQSSGQAVAEAALTCNLAYAEILTEEGDDADDEDDEDNTTLYCLTKRSGYAYRESIPSVLPAAFVEEHREAISAGTLKVSVASQYLVTDDNDVQTLVVPDQSIDALIVVRTSNNDIRERRRLSKEVRSGRKRLLAVRLLANGGTEVPPETLPDIRNAIFGSASTQNLPTVTSQYAAVSHGKLQIVPAQGPGIQDGVIEITMQASLATGNVSIQGPMLEDILRSTANALGDLDEVADHIIFCLPSGSLLNGKAKWTAFTYLYEPYSYYQRSRCTKLSVPMHELGHGVLGYKHSGKGRDRYADEQGYMGYAANVPYGPQKGFNAHKHWLSGWFDDRAFDLGEEILTKGALGAPLVSFVDASNLFLPEGEAVILKLGDLYIQYNLAKSYNVGTYKDQEDRVTINYAESDEAVSDLVGALAENDVYIQPNFAGSGIDLIIQVCSVGADELGDIDYAVLSIHMDDGMHSSLCQDPNIAQHTWFDQRRGWMSESDSFPSVAPSFNEDFLEYEEEEPIVDIDGTGEPAPEVAEEPSAVRAPTPSPVAAVNKNVDDNLVVESEKSQPDEMNSVWGESADEEQQASPVSILMVVIIALSSMVIVGFVYLRFRGDTSAEPVEKSKGKPEELDTTETDLSDRSEEDDIIEVWVPSPTKSTLEVTQLCL